MTLDYFDAYGIDDADTDDAPCQTCGGDGVEECETVGNVEGCWRPDCTGNLHACSNCGGSGRAKDQCWW